MEGQSGYPRGMKLSKPKAAKEEEEYF